MALITQLQSLSVVTGIVSRLAAPGDVLQRLLGVQIGGPNITPVSGRQYSYDIFDFTRDAAVGKRPGTPPSLVTPVAVNTQRQAISRQYEKLALSYELLHNLRALGENAGVRDAMGKRYIEKQATEMKRRANNFRELWCAAILTKGILYFKNDPGIGDDLIPTLTAPDNATTWGDTLDFLIPAANKSQLNMLGAGDIIGTTWDNAAAHIPQNIFDINAAFVNLTGQMLSRVLISSKVWNYIITNTDVRNVAGSANQPFAKFDVVDAGPGTNEAGLPTSLLQARLNFAPWVTWHVYDGVLNIDGTTTKLLPDTQATFMIEPDGTWIKGIEGSEPVKRNPMDPATEQFGFLSWIREWDEPARFELHSLQNFLLELNRPKGIAIGTVKF